MVDKRGIKILSACVVSTALITLIFLIVLRFTQLNCELVVIDPAQLRLTALNNWSKEKPIRSHDKSMLVKLAAYLEFNVNANGNVGAVGSSAINTLHNNNNNWQQDFNKQQQQPVLNAQQSTWTSSPNQHQVASNQQAAQQPFGSSQQSAVSSTANQQQQQGHVNFIQQQQPTIFNNTGVNMMNAVSPIQSNLSTTTAPSSSSSSQQSKEKDSQRKFLPLQLEDVDMKKLDENRYRYAFEMNCNVLYVVFVRRPDRVYVQSISLEKLKPHQNGTGRTSCEVQLPNQGAFSVEVHEGWARYYCDQPLHFPCYYRQPGAPQVNQLLAELHIHSFEFELAANGTKAHHKSHDFLALRSECSPMP